MWALYRDVTPVPVRDGTLLSSVVEASFLGIFLHVQKSESPDFQRCVRIDVYITLCSTPHNGKTINFIRM